MNDDKCEFCKGAGKEPGEAECVWCHSTGTKAGQRLLTPLGEELCDTCNGQGDVATGTITHHGYNQPPEPDLEVCPECSGEKRWYVAGDIDSLVRELDVLLNGDRAAPQAQLCDLVAQVAASKQRQGEPVELNPKGSGSLEFDGLLAEYHAIVWASAEDSDGVDYDLAGIDTAKKLQALHRAALERKP